MKFIRGNYNVRLFLGDCFGGTIAALIALPYGLAMAQLMGLPPVLGVFTSILTAPITAILGRNPVLVGGTASATVPFIAAAVRQQGLGGAAKISLVAAAMMMAFAIMRLGRYIYSIPLAVVSGFSCGIGAMMFISQLHVILGVAAPLGRAGESAVALLVETLGQIGHMRAASFALGLVVVVGATAAASRSYKLPAPLLGVLAALLVARIFGLHEHEVGALPAAFPPFIGFSWAPGDVFTVLPSALGLAVVSSANLLITSRVVEHFRLRRKHLKRTDADAELGAYGIANLCAGMFAAPMSVGIPARSIAIVRCGGTTRVSNLMHGLFLVAFLQFGAGFVSHIPIAALAGVTAWTGLRLLEWSTWRRLDRMSRADAAAFLITACAVLVVNAIAAVAAGCLIYALRAIYYRFVRPGPVGAPEGTAMDTPPGAPAVVRQAAPPLPELQSEFD
jgi:sulfate permease, SulP family